MDYQKAQEFVKLVTNIAGCVSAIQLIDNGCSIVDNQNTCNDRTEYFKLLEQHQKRLKYLLTH